MEMELLEHALREGLRDHAAEVPSGAGARMNQVDFHPSPYRHPATRWAGPAVAATTVVSVGVVSGILASAGSSTGPIVGGPVHGLHPAVDAQTIAYRTTTAVESASSSQIEHLQVSIGGLGKVKVISEQWVFGSNYRSEESAPDGTPVFGISETAGGCQASVRAVNYQDHTWYEGSGGVIMAGPDVQFAQSNVADEIRQELADGQLRSAGRTELAGGPALELNGVLQGTFEDTMPAGCIPPSSGPDANKIAKAKSLPDWDYTVWVDPTTYLPVQFRATNPGPGGGATVDGSIQWLPASTQNLAQLVQPIPPGFTQDPGMAG